MVVTLFLTTADWRRRRRSVGLVRFLNGRGPGPAGSHPLVPPSRASSRPLVFLAGWLPSPHSSIHHLLNILPPYDNAIIVPSHSLHGVYLWAPIHIIENIKRIVFFLSQLPHVFCLFDFCFVLNITVPLVTTSWQSPTPFLTSITGIPKTTGTATVKFPTNQSHNLHMGSMQVPKSVQAVQVGLNDWTRNGRSFGRTEPIPTITAQACSGRWDRCIQVLPGRKQVLQLRQHCCREPGTDFDSRHRS